MEAREDTSLDEFVSSNIKMNFTVQIECEQCRSSPSVEKLTSAKNYQKLISCAHKIPEEPLEPAYSCRSGWLRAYLLWRSAKTRSGLPDPD